MITLIYRRKQNLWTHIFPSQFKCRLACPVLWTSRLLLRKLPLLSAKLSDQPHQKAGWCHSPAGIRAARAALHPWEEPCISGLHGSGTIFFSGCTLRCCFCQNYQISSEGFGKDISETRPRGIFWNCRHRCAQYQSGDADSVPSVATARLKTGQTAAFHPYRLQLRRLWDTGGGWRAGSLYRYLAAGFKILLLRAVRPLLRRPGLFFGRLRSSQTDDRAHSPLVLEDFSENDQTCQLMKRGVILRHMVLPKHKDDSIRLLHWIHDNLPEGHFLVSLMSQYTPFYQSSKYPEINRRITSYEYQKSSMPRLSWGSRTALCRKKAARKKNTRRRLSYRGFDL